MSSPALARLVSLINAAEARGLKMGEIARITGRPRSWLIQVRDGTTKNPGIVHVESAIRALEIA
ncbi:helix-turn-helix protein [Caudoviricetes sp.]|nr:helix-turn-helix protein [Caudoviricetes sp.]